MAAPAREKVPGEPGRLWLYLGAGTAALFLVLPIFLILPMSLSDSTLLRFPPEGLSLRWYEKYWDSFKWQEATRMSLLVACLTTLCAVPAGGLAAYALRVGRFRFADAVWAVIMAPLIVPIVLLGLGLFFVFAMVGLNNSVPGMVIAHTVLAIPFVFVTMSAALRGFDLNQPRVACSLGASPLRAFLTVTLPQLKTPVAISALLAFLASFDEVVIALFISGGRHSTLPKLMFSELRMTIDPTIAAVSSIMICVALGIMIATQYLQRSPRRL